MLDRRIQLGREGHVSEDVQVSEKDVNRVEKAVKQGNHLSQVFPRLTSVGATFEGEGPTVQVRFVKRGGAPVTYIAADDPREAAAVREVDLQRKYHLTKRDLVEVLGLTVPRSTALRRLLGIDDDDDCVHVFQFDSLIQYRYSDNALRAMKDALDDGLDMDAVWKEQGPKIAPGRR